MKTVHRQILHLIQNLEMHNYYYTPKVGTRVCELASNGLFDTCQNCMHLQNKRMCLQQENKIQSEHKILFVGY